MKSGKKDVIILILSIGILTSGSVYIYLSLQVPYRGIILNIPQRTLVVGVPSSPPYIDPTDSWDSNAINVINQVVECLWGYNFSDPDIPRIHMLAVDEDWISNTQLRVFLREGVRFHDGTVFDAEAVQWNLDRLMYLCNFTRELDPNTQRPAKTHSLFEFSDGTPILNHFEIVNDTVIDIFLTAPYSPLMDLMCCVACGMLSPASTPATRFIRLEDEDLVGTGPFDYEEYILDTEIRFLRWYSYWKEPTEFDRLIYKCISDPNARSYAMLAKSIDYLIGVDLIGDEYDLLNLFNNSLIVTVKKEVILDVEYSYFIMNNNKINSTWRKAISYAINYSQILEFAENYYHHCVSRAQSPISLAFFGYDQTNKAPDHNLTFSREIMINMGYGESIWSDTQWRNAEFVRWNYSYSTSQEFNEEMYQILENSLDLIGINLTKDILWSMWPIWSSYWDHNNFDIFYAKWSPTYLDPIDTLFNLISNSSKLNFGQVNDPLFEQKITEAIQELNETARAETYSELQHYLTEELFPHIFGYHKTVYNVYASDLYDILYNPLGTFYAYPIKRNDT